MKLTWTTLSADRDGKPTCRVCRLPRLVYGGLMLWHERSLYAIMSVDREGTCYPTGFESRTLRGILELLDVAKPSAVEYSPEPQTPGLVAQCAQLLQRGALLGARVSAGRHTPAVPDGFSWCVLDLQGSPLVLCNDATVALSWFNELEAKTEEAWAWDRDALRESPYRAPSDEEIEDNRFAERALDLYYRGLVAQHEVDAALGRAA